MKHLFYFNRDAFYSLWCIYPFIFPGLIRPKSPMKAAEDRLKNELNFGFWLSDLFGFALIVDFAAIGLSLPGLIRNCKVSKNQMTIIDSQKTILASSFLF